MSVEITDLEAQFSSTQRHPRQTELGDLPKARNTMMSPLHVSSHNAIGSPKAESEDLGSHSKKVSAPEESLQIEEGTSIKHEKH